MSEQFNGQWVRKDIVLNIAEYFKKNGPNSKAVIGLSGGKDSSIVAALCVEALGPDRVIGAWLPNENSNEQDREIVEDLVEHLGIQRLYSVNIGNALNSVYSELDFSRLLSGTSVDEIVKQASTLGYRKNDLVAFNTPALMRCLVLQTISRFENGRVSQNSNASELYIGWVSKGENGDFAPIAKYTCTEVIEIGKAIPDFPEKFVIKPPEDGLCGKSDEESFGFTYAELDQFIRGGVVSSANKDKFTELHKNSEYKRREIAHSII